MYQWNLPGVYYDEVILTNQAFGLLEGDWPVIGNVSYVGAVNAYLHAPFVALCSGSVFGLRAVPVMLSLATGWMYFRFVRRLFDSEPAALWALAIFLLHPVILFSIRVDDGPVSTQLFFEVGVLLFLHRAITGDRLQDFAFAGLFMGLGIWQKASFGGLLILLCCFLPFWIRLNRSRLVGGVVFGAGVLCGAAPILIYHVIHDWSFPDYATNVEGFRTVIPKWKTLWEILLGVERVRKVTGLRPMLPALTFLPLVASLFLLPWSRQKKIQMASWAALLILMLCAVVPHASGRNARHFVLLFPFLPIPIVAAWSGISGRWKACFTGLLAVTLVTQLIGVGFTHYALRQTGGSWCWSQASEELVHALEKDPDRMTLSMDWGIHETLVYLSGNDLILREYGWIYPGVPGGVEGIRRVLEQHPQARWVFHEPGREVFPQARQSFEQVLNQTGRKELLELEVSEASGMTLFRVSRVAEAPDNL